MANTTFAYGITQDETIVPNSFPIGASYIGLDATGALVPAVRTLGAGIFVVSTAALTDAALAAACLAFAKAHGLAHEGAGGARSDPSGTVPAASLSVLAGGWTAPE
jgi:hypothetical protein